MKHLLALVFILLCFVGVSAQGPGTSSVGPQSVPIQFVASAPTTCTLNRLYIVRSSGVAYMNILGSCTKVFNTAVSLPTSATQGDILYASAANAYSNLAKSTSATRYLSNTGTSNNPAWAQVALDTGVSGRLPFANLTQGSALSVLGVTGNATADVASIAAGTDNQVLRRSGTSLAFGAVNLASSNAVAGALPAANGGTGLSALGTALQQLRVNAGATALEYFTASAGITNSAGNNVIPKSNGTNLVASRISDDGAIINAGETPNPLDVYANTYITLDTASLSLVMNTGDGGSTDIYAAAGLATIDMSASGISIAVAPSTTNTNIALSRNDKTIVSTASTESLAIDGTAHTITATAAAGFKASGTATNNDAAAGFIGEYQTAALASGSATSLTTGTAKTVISISLTAGDWDVYGVLDYIPAATTTTAFVQQGLSQTTNTLGGEGTFTSSSGGNLTGTVLGSLIAENVPYQRISLSTTTTIYLVGKASFAVSTMTAYGSIFARRAR